MSEREIKRKSERKREREREREMIDDRWAKVRQPQRFVFTKSH